MATILIIGGIGVALLLIAIFGEKSQDYPPKDEKGRPMILSYSIRGGSRWISQPD
ncbi:hypothetical protein JW977_00460 [Candidatus Falkowbacteria bacterium]|nr:hypothetical protein [Candidatus Falkowbacteria bacterium]